MPSAIQTPDGAERTTTPPEGLTGAAVGGLRLTRLTLHGFKSFADRTVFTFEDPLTGVVGPNGCGKSNIVDAIKWVLGERSSKSLRGKEMIDVIFAGSAGRKPSGMAGVTLTFENPLLDDASGDTIDPAPSPVQAGLPESAAPVHAGLAPAHDEHLSDADADAAADEGASEAAELIAQRGRVRRPLPVDAGEVEVERRLYRDGKSQYLINGRLARLKDIRDLFLDTGIGADAYSIIEQGKVDAMLLASPMERRAIFEEAAGIAKYRQRRVEAERKLEKTEQNLAVTREQLASTERRLRIVRGQAAKAKRFRELDAECTALRLALAFEQYDDIRLRLEGLTSQLRGLEGQKREVEQALRDLDAARQHAEGERQEAFERRRHLDTERTESTHAAERAEQRRAMAERAIEDAASRVEAETSRVREAAERLASIDADLEARRTLAAELGEKLAAAEARVRQTAEDRAALLESLGDRRRELAERRGRVGSIERDRAGLLARAQGDERRLESLGEQLDRAEKRLAELLAQRDQAATSAAVQAERVRERSGGIASLAAALDNAAGRWTQLDGGRRRLAERVAELDQRFVRLDSRRQTLEEMVTARVGLTESVRAVLEARESGRGFAGVTGSLSELIELRAGVDEQAIGGAVETALGTELQAILVRTRAEMPGTEELSSLRGRVAFVALDTPAGPEGEPAARALARMIGGGRVVALRDAVAPRDGHDPALSRALAALLDRLLAHTLLVDTLDTAMLLSAGPLRTSRTRFVTRDGCVVEPDGRVIAGPTDTDESAGVLRRRRELDALRGELAGLTGELAAARTALEAADADAARLEARRTQLATEAASAERALVQDQTALDRHQAEAERLTRELDRLSEEAEQLRVRLAGIERDRGDLLDRAERLGRLHAEEAQHAAALEKELSEADARVHQSGEQAAAAREDAGRLAEQLGAAKREAGTLERSRDEAERRRDESDRHIAGARERLAELRGQVEQAAAERDEAAARRDALAEALAVASAEAQAAERRVREQAESGRAVRDRAQRFERDWHAIESARRELEVRRETAEERALDELSLELPCEYLHYRAMMAGGEVARIDVPECSARATVLRDEIKKLGPVNLDSIVEESTLDERNDDLIRQVKDIDEARIKLATLIEKLNIASRERFGEVFGRIKEEFGGKNGMFRKLFGGGSAEVRLMGLVKEVDGQKVVTDQTDLLESGIEVIAKPPGKEPRSISQLSGGEKTMTAVAMLLAIFRSKPSCFCILDEVDAALDEANVGRYCATIRQFTDLSRFIVITHNKRTMQAVDRLYGVTMQERGVSKRVSVKFEQVGEDGSIKATPQMPEEPAAEAAPAGAIDRPAEMPAGKPTKSPTGGLRAALAAMRESAGEPVREAAAD